LVLGGESTPSRAVVLVAGEAWRVKADFIRPEVRLVTPVLHLMLRFVQAMMTQMTQTGVCNRHHSIDAQLCRWLLLVIDRLPVNEFAMTQEFVASMLGVRRESVTEAAGRLQLAGLIRYMRGQITVLSRTGLERRVCECYRVVQKEYERLLPDRLAT
jgi:CRP-like cAMP-binding protein